MFGFGVFTFLVRQLAGGFILAFHEIDEERFTEQIESLDRFRAVPLDEVVERKTRGLSTAGLFAITVDDGVGQNVRRLAKVLGAKGWPATFYVPTSYLDSRRPMPFQLWRQMAPLLPREAVQVGNERFDLARRSEFHRLGARLEGLWRTRPADAYMPLLDELRKIVAAQPGFEPRLLEEPAPIGWDEVQRLSRNDLLRFESHGTAHVAVSSMTEQDLELEMRSSQERIEAATGRPCRHFCYPFGSPESIGSLAPQVARRFYDSAVTMEAGPVDAGDRWLLPRVAFYPENSLVMAELMIGLYCMTHSMSRE